MEQWTLSVECGSGRVLWLSFRELCSSGGWCVAEILVRQPLCYPGLRQVGSSKLEGRNLLREIESKILGGWDIRIAAPSNPPAWRSFFLGYH